MNSRCPDKKRRASDAGRIERPGGEVTARGSCWTNRTVIALGKASNWTDRYLPAAAARLAESRLVPAAAGTGPATPKRRRRSAPLAALRKRSPSTSPTRRHAPPPRSRAGWGPMLVSVPASVKLSSPSRPSLRTMSTTACRPSFSTLLELSEIKTHFAMLLSFLLITGLHLHVEVPRASMPFVSPILPFLHRSSPV